jgi:hypothetical protein
MVLAISHGALEQLHPDEGSISEFDLALLKIVEDLGGEIMRGSASIPSTARTQSALDRYPTMW